MTSMASASSSATSATSATASTSSSTTTSSSSSVLPATQLADLRDIFAHFDRHGTGALNVAQVTQALHFMGLDQITEIEVQDMISEIDVGQSAGKGMCTFDDFVVLCSRDYSVTSNSAPLPPPLRDALLRAYQTLDWDKDGKINADDLTRAFAAIGHVFDATMIRDMICEVDSTGSGKISKDDFLNALSPC